MDTNETPNGDELTAAERARLRQMLEAEARWSWLRSTMRAWALAIVAVVTGATVGLDALRSVLKRILQ